MGEGYLFDKEATVLGKSLGEVHDTNILPCMLVDVLTERFYGFGGYCQEQHVRLVGAADIPGGDNVAVDMTAGEVL